MSDCVSRLIDVATAPPLNARFSKNARASATALNWSASRRSPILGEHGTGGLQTRGAQPNWAGIACRRAANPWGATELGWDRMQPCCWGEDFGLVGDGPPRASISGAPIELRARLVTDCYSDWGWRRVRDSNPRWAFDPYTLSRGAPSTTRPTLRRLPGRDAQVSEGRQEYWPWPVR